MRGGRIDEALDVGCSGRPQQPGRGNAVYLERAHGICNTVPRVHSREMYNRVHALAHFTQSVGGMPAGLNYAGRWQPVEWRGRLPRSQNKLTYSCTGQVLCKASSDVPEPARNQDLFQANVRASNVLLVRHLPVIGNAAVERCPALYLTVVVRQRCAVCEYGERVADALEPVPQERRNRYQTVVLR